MVSERPLCRQGTAALLRRPGWHVTECGTVSQLVAAGRARALDAVVVDLDHVSSDLYTLVRQIRSIVDGKLVVTGSSIRQAAIDLDVTAAADGDATAVIAAITSTKRRRFRGTSWSALTSRQRDVLRWLAIGLDNKSIGRQLGIGERAVKAHVTALLALFELDNRTQLALLSSKAGYRPALSIMSRRRAA